MMKKEMALYIGADHAGFALKEKIKKYLIKKGILYNDLTPIYNEKDDYPSIAFRVAQQVAREKNTQGILICGTGTGMVIAANKVRKVRAVAAYDSYSARMSREHNNANILCLRGKNFPFAKIRDIVSIWLKTSFRENVRHLRRLQAIAQYER